MGRCIHKVLPLFFEVVKPFHMQIPAVHKVDREKLCEENLREILEKKTTYPCQH